MGATVFSRTRFWLKNWRIPVRWRIGRKNRVTLGAHTYGTARIHWWGEDADLTIGRFCSIARNVEIFLGGNHRPDWVTTYPFSVLREWPEAAGITGHPASRGSVRIGNDVWIGTGATIL